MHIHTLLKMTYEILLNVSPRSRWSLIGLFIMSLAKTSDFKTIFPNAESDLFAIKNAECYKCVPCHLLIQFARNVDTLHISGKKASKSL